MSVLVLSACAFLVSILTFFSGFGLGTVLTPIFAIWFPVDLAIALTAIVHLLNNLFKLALVGRFADREAILRFGIPALGAAALGAWVLVQFSHLPPMATYSLGGRDLEIHPLKLMIAVLISVFTFFELVPSLKNWTVDRKYLPYGGILSGFFGGLSGHQGALRSAFLVRLGLTTEGFIATGVAIACLIDVVRLGVYSRHFTADGYSENKIVLLSATLAAFAGAYLGSKLLKKVTMNTVQKFVSIGLFALAVALGAGMI